MANEKISDMLVATLVGTELVEVVQSGVNKQTTTQDIGNLGGGGGDSLWVYSAGVLSPSSATTPLHQFNVATDTSLSFIVDNGVNNTTINSDGDFVDVVANFSDTSITSVTINNAAATMHAESAGTATFSDIIANQDGSFSLASNDGTTTKTITADTSFLSFSNINNATSGKRTFIEMDARGTPNDLFTAIRTELGDGSYCEFDTTSDAIIGYATGLTGSADFFLVKEGSFSLTASDGTNTYDVTAGSGVLTIDANPLSGGTGLVLDAAAEIARLHVDSASAFLLLDGGAGGNVQLEGAGSITISGTDMPITGSSSITITSPSITLFGPTDVINYFDIHQISTPAAPADNIARLFVRDNGSGKMQLCVKFGPAGTSQVILTEP